MITFTTIQYSSLIPFCLLWLDCLHLGVQPVMHHVVSDCVWSFSVSVSFDNFHNVHPVLKEDSSSSSDSDDWNEDSGKVATIGYCTSETGAISINL